MPPTGAEEALGDQAIGRAVALKTRNGTGAVSKRSPPPAAYRPTGNPANKAIDEEVMESRDRDRDDRTRPHERSRKCTARRTSKVGTPTLTG